MKRFINMGILLLASVGGFGQVMQASIGAGSSATRVKVYIKPDLAVNGFISTLQFDVAIDPSVTPVPTVSVIGTPAFGITWYIDPSYIEDGWRHYQFTTASSPSVTIGAGVETLVMELEFAGGPVSPNNVSLVTLPAGGATGNALFFCSGAATSVEGQLYYVRAGTTVINNMSYTGPLPSSATIGGILLPVTWLSFNAARQNNDALLNWSVADEESNHHYNLQRSQNGTDFGTIATINKTGTGSGMHNYSYTDPGITSLGSSVIYYRLKQVDIDGRISYSEVRVLHLNGNTGKISVFPNPAQDGFYLNIPFATTDNNIYTFNLFTLSGQLVQSREVTALLATNYYFDISKISLATGQYNLQIIQGKKILTTEKLIISK